MWSGRLLATLFLGFGFMTAATGGPVWAQDRMAGAELVQALRRGGYVIYFRHTATVAEQADTDRTHLDRCETQRNLSAEGRRQARQIGEAFRTLRIPVGVVLASPFCRAADTAQLAFGRHDKAPVLVFAVGIDREQRQRQTLELRRILGTAPGPGTNTVLVAHHANLKEATGVWPRQEGDAHVFRPRADGGFDHVAEVPVEAWAALARTLAAGR